MLQFIGRPFGLELVSLVIVEADQTLQLLDDFGVDSTSEQQGVFCEINGVKLLAKTAADCEEAGGTVTHVISTTVTPAGEATDNPEEEPEIQREKDKEPEAQ